ncbi:MAG: DUF4040 domain-containing protein [Anaerolineae bacterium]|nr:DUF4040 domain-containing protein [Anaerolineae bacterium]NUQ02911.1 DUF4040 domain-containing protein [Anaerolineae bacterium]
MIWDWSAMEFVLAASAPFGIALLLSAVGSRLPRRWHTLLTAGASAGLFGWLLGYLPIVTQQGAVETSYEWVSALGLRLTLYLDGLALLFGLLITGVGGVVALYTSSYFESEAEANRFTALLFAFMGAMLWLVLSGNLITLFIAWELTSITSYLLIGFKGDKEAAARTGAMQALVITGGGGLALLVGLALLGTAAGTFEMSGILGNTALRDHPHYTALAILIFVGCFTKSAQFPFQFWLPGAMAAPSPASAYLHSATMVKAGIYLLARLYPALGSTELWTSALLGIGLTTMLVGAVIALGKRDLKGLLAYSTVSQLGALVALLGLPDSAGLKAAFVGILAHGLYKAALFLTAGAVDHATGTRIIDRLGGLAKTLPGWTAVAVVSALSMAGIPPLFGFVGKEVLLDAVIGSYEVASLPLVIVGVSAALTVTAALILIFDVFLGAPRDSHAHGHPPGAAMLIGPALLTVGTLALGLLLEPLIVPIITPAVPKAFVLHLFHGITPPLIVSIIAVVAGAAVFALRRSWLAIRPPALPSGAGVYERAVAGASWIGDRLLSTQNGKLRVYLTVILGAVALLMLPAILAYNGQRSVDFTLRNTGDVLKLILLFVSVGATVAAIRAQRRFVAALFLGVMGYSMGVVFLLEPAPDVALVQFLVETLSTILIIVMISRISLTLRDRATRIESRQKPLSRLRDIAIAGIMGLMVGLFALGAVINRPVRESNVSDWYIANAKSQIGITDVVGSVVTDFRGMDTLFEITVFGFAALSVLTLLTLPQSRELLTGKGRARRHTDGPYAHVPEEDTYGIASFSTPLTRMAATVVLPFAVIIALVHLLYGGDAPGDGFTAGVVSGLAVALWYVVFGYYEAKRRLHRLRPGALIGVGIGLALINAALPLAFGRPFLAHTGLDIDLPAGLHVSSTLLFEMGIFLAVFGGSSVVIEAIAHPKEVETL